MKNKLDAIFCDNCNYLIKIEVYLSEDFKEINNKYEHLTLNTDSDFCSYACMKEWLDRKIVMVEIEKKVKCFKKGDIIKVKCNGSVENFIFASLDDECLYTIFGDFVATGESKFLPFEDIVFE